MADKKTRSQSDEYQVGYGKPPKHSQFQKGRSGNPSGRAKGARNLKTELADELDEKIVVREGKAQKRVTKRRAMIKAQTAKAVQGDTRAANLLSNLALRLLEADEAIGGDSRLIAEDQSILDDFMRRQRQAETEGEGRGDD